MEMVVMCPIKTRIKLSTIFTILIFILLECSPPKKLSQVAVCKKCDLTIAALVSESANNLNYQQVNEFLCAFDNLCENNAEFSEASNEALFQALLNKPELVLRSLTENATLSKEFILLQLSRPVNDRIDLKSIQAKVSAIGNYADAKGQVLKSLKEASAKY
jgi:hypothetical protein